MTSPAAELQDAILDRLLNDAAVNAVVGRRIFDRVQKSYAVMPYVQIGRDEMTSSDADCITGFEVFIPIEVWSDGVGMIKVKEAAETIRKALLGSDLSLSNNALVSFEHRQTSFRDDADRLTTNARIEFTAFIEQP